jgi:ribose 5-phosphate isomerase A
MNGGGREEAKRRAGESAAAAVEDGTVVGLGTGSTAAHAIRALGRRVDAGLDVAGIPTSYQSREAAVDAGVPLTSLDRETPDVAIDGADQVAGGDLLKGGGAAHVREKIVDSAADRLLVVADPTKEVDRLDAPVPVAVVPDARPTVAAAVGELGGDPGLRAAANKDGPVVTDDGNLVLDCAFGPIDDPAGLACELAGLPGLVDHGLFVGMATAVHVGTADGVTVRRVA